jgi:hypothetical protein
MDVRKAIIKEFVGAIAFLAGARASGAVKVPSSPALFPGGRREWPAVFLVIKEANRPEAFVSMEIDHGKTVLQGQGFKPEPV